MRCSGLAALIAVPVMAAMAGEPETFRVERGAQIPLVLMNDISTRNAIPGDAIYLRTTFPVASEGRVVVPPGSWVMGTITEVGRARRGQRRGELHVRFDTLQLANGVTHALHGDLGAHQIVGEEHDRAATERAISRYGSMGARIGPIAQIASGNFGYAGLIGGAAAGAAAGVALVLTERGREAILPRGSAVVMVLSEPLTFSRSELRFNGRGPE